MKNFMKMGVTFIIAAAVLLAACGGAAESTPAGDLPPPPQQYSGLVNPYASDPEAQTAQESREAEIAGQTIYQNNCASCHGEEGMGDGPAAESLEPAPTDLAEIIDLATDDYLFWRIKEGGGMAPFNSAMPAFGDSLSDIEIWQVITYLRTLG